MSVCQYDHQFDGHHCPTCKEAKREAQRADVVRTKVKGEPDALAPDDDWREDAACRFPPHGLSADGWFEQQKTLANRERCALAKAVCDDSPVLAACLRYAVDTAQPWGIWGGMTAEQRGTAYHQPQRVA